MNEKWVNNINSRLIGDHEEIVYCGKAINYIIRLL